MKAWAIPSLATLMEVDGIFWWTRDGGTGAKSDLYQDKFVLQHYICLAASMEGTFFIFDMYTSTFFSGSSQMMQHPSCIFEVHQAVWSTPQSNVKYIYW